MRAAARLVPIRSRWSLNIGKELTIFQVGNSKNWSGVADVNGESLMPALRMIVLLPQNAAVSTGFCWLVDLETVRGLCRTQQRFLLYLNTRYNI
jgi:hypothetical protein